MASPTNNIYKKNIVNNLSSNTLDTYSNFTNNLNTLPTNTIDNYANSANNLNTLPTNTIDNYANLTNNLNTLPTNTIDNSFLTLKEKLDNIPIYTDPNRSD